MDATNEQSSLSPAITFLNMSGDVTICWDDSNKDRIRELVTQKMAQGYSFFVLTPRAIPFLPRKKTRLTNPRQLDSAVGVVVTDDVVEAIVGNLGDTDVEAAVKSGAAVLAPAPATRSHNTVRRASSVDEVLRQQTLAVRPITGG